MTVQYAIVAFPTFDSPEAIEGVRQVFDPHASLLPAHITLVFPFTASQDAASLRAHLHALIATTSGFDVTLAPPSVEQDQYLCLRVEAGRRQVIDLHDTLYSGPLQPYLSLTHPYDPHVTIGRLPSLDALTAAAVVARERLPATSRALIESVSLFSFEDSVGRVEFTVPLAPASGSRSSPMRSAPNER